MATRRTVSLLLTAIVAVWWGVGPADAEWNFDLYGGAAWIENSDLKVRGQDNTNASISATIFNVDTNPGFTVGTRVSYWLNPVPFLGFDLDVFYLQVPVPAQTTSANGAFTGDFLDKPISVSASGVAKVPSATLPLFGFAPELRLRWPLLVDAAFPYGRLQPYFTGGPAWAFSLKNDHVTVEFGGKVGGGLTYLFKPWFGVYSEYRYIFFPGFELTDKNLTYKANINSHTVVAGVTFRF